MHIYAYMYLFYDKYAYFVHILHKYAYKYTMHLVHKYEYLLPLLTGFLSNKYHKYVLLYIYLKSDILCSKNR